MKDFIYDNLYRQDQFHWWYRGKREIVLSLLDTLPPREPKGKIIDFGCGCGLMLKELDRYGEPTGADFSKQALDYCRKRFSGPLVQQDLSIPYAGEGKYALGIALDILDHIPDDRTAAENLCRFLEPGGTCVITVPANQWMWSAHDENCMHVRRYSRQSLQRLLTGAGFHIDYISYYNSLLFFPAALSRLASRALHLDQDDTMESAFQDNWLNRLLYHVFRSEKYWIAKGRHFPFGVSLIAVVTKPLPA